MRAPTAVAVLIAFAAAVPSFAEDEGAARSAGAVAPRVAVQEPSALAEHYLSTLARKTKKARTIGGVLATAVGAVGLAGGLDLVNRDDEEDPFCWGEVFGRPLIVVGGLCIAMGVFSLAVTSPAERSYKRVRDISDPGEREAACADALARLAKTGRRSRMIGGGLICAAGVAGAIANGGDDPSGPLLMAAFSGGLAALYTFLVKSPEEKSNRAYLERSRVKPVPELILGVGPRGSVRAGLSLDF
ncbi:MAG TPA: hypothetical protein PLP83_04315 [Candidatus Aminicenantes bacterium]|nr:hypothetical protein [Candidatus Aminicenantes bacterium]